MSKSSKRSAGLLMYRESKDGVEIFLVHPGGPFWASKDEGVWTIPKGEYEPEEEPLAAAKREFHEETSFIATGDFMPLGSIRQKSGKIVIAWAFAGDCDPTQLKSNTCKVEWPPKSGKRLEIPEVDRGAWFSGHRARIYMRPEQIPLLDALESFTVTS